MSPDFKELLNLFKKHNVRYVITGGLGYPLCRHEIDMGAPISNEIW